jgi:acetoin utilization deacetylase AcuC-like enzyme
LLETKLEEQAKDLRLALMFNEKLLAHDPLSGLADGGRLSSILAQLKADGLWMDFYRDSDIAPMKRLRDIHDAEFLNDLHRRSYSGLDKLDANTPLIKESFEIARFGAGGVLDAVDKIMGGEVERAFCLTAMPGHHAGISTSGYGSLVNPIAAGAHYLTKKYGLKRVAIIDLDGEHGSGTQQIFYGRKDVMTVSVHEYPGVTGTGYYDELGGKGALGHNFNIPFASGYGDREYRVCFKEFIEKIMWQYMPQFILVGYGTNILLDDSVSHLRVTEQGLLQTHKLLLDMAQGICGGKYLAVLEGGSPGELMARSVSKFINLLVNNTEIPADKVSKDELISYADWYGYAKLLRAQFKKYWRL